MELDEHQLKNRIQWVRDLRSGQFTQGLRKLKRVDNNVTTYCCLGVACERVDPSNVSLMLHQTHTGDDSYSMAAAMMTSTFAFDEFGLSSADQADAAAWNDSGDYDFNRIADLIAWSTEHRIRFASVKAETVPDGYSVEWLKQFD